jgi:glycerophosphoryl diester phosphodiesterase
VIATPILLDPARHPVIGHRGAAGAAPENTLESLRLAVVEGADAVEFDVRLSAEGVPVLLHDPVLDRTTNGGGPVAGRNTNQLAELDAGYRFTPDGGVTFPWRARGVRVPALRSVLSALSTVPLLIELKTVDAAAPVLRLLLEHEAAERVVVASFLEAALAPFRATPIPTSASRPRIFRRWLLSALRLPWPRGPDRAYSVPDRYRDRVSVPTPGFIRAARRSGCPVHVWTVDDPARAAVLWGLGACGMISNFPARLLDQRDRLFPAEARAHQP